MELITDTQINPVHSMPGAGGKTENKNELFKMEDSLKRKKGLNGFLKEG